MSFLVPIYMALKIGDIRIENQLALAPMAAVGNLPFRLMCRRYGAGLIYTPMINAYNLYMQRDPSRTLVDIDPDERPVAIQLIGSKPEALKAASSAISEKADIIDINMGCPESDLLAQKCGAYLIKETSQIERVVKAVIAGTNRPVTAKIRIGWDSHSINHVKVARMLEDYGVSAIAVHGRTRKQGYSGKANWTAIKQVKEKVNVPVIGNGDIFSPHDARKMLEFSSCDIVMIGRAAIGNPYIFKRCDQFLNHGKMLSRADADNKFKQFLEFVKLYDKHMLKENFSEIRDHALWFAKGIKGARRLKDRISACENIAELRKAWACGQ
jgi:tRNA-dihydrouridine synthase B